MVNVQPRNAKLVERAIRIVGQAAGIAPQAAARYFEEAGRDVRTAIVMAKLRVDRTEAQRRLTAARGRVSEALR
jgi:N-acetylmuramic acid 6-phosphate etherase